MNDAAFFRHSPFREKERRKNPQIFPTFKYKNIISAINGEAHAKPFKIV